MWRDRGSAEDGVVVFIVFGERWRLMLVEAGRVTSFGLGAGISIEV